MLLMRALAFDYLQVLQTLAARKRLNSGSVAQPSPSAGGGQGSAALPVRQQQPHDTRGDLMEIDAIIASRLI